MKRFTKLIGSILLAGALYLPACSVSDGPVRDDSSKRSYCSPSCQMVRESLKERVALLDESLRRNVAAVEEVFDGITLRGELGVEAKVYKNKSKDGYYYLLMASIDKYTDGSSEDKMTLLNSLCYSFDHATFLSKLSEYSDLGSVVSDGRGRGVTFTLEDGITQIYVGVKYYDNVGKKEDCLVLKIKVSASDSGYQFEGFGNGDSSYML